MPPGAKSITGMDILYIMYNVKYIHTLAQIQSLHCKITCLALRRSAISYNTRYLILLSPYLLQVASDMLKEVARRVEDEPQWVPASWVHDQ